MKNKTPYPKGWKKTPEQIIALWHEIDAAARGILLNPRDLRAAKSYSDLIAKATKQIERARAADAIDSVK